MYPANERDEKELDMMIRERALVPYKGMVIEIYVAKTDGSEERAITNLSRISFAPHYHPDGDRVIFTSDARAEGHGVYHLYIVNTDGMDLEQVSFRDGFDGFPHFSPDGKHLVWISDRNAKKRGELNVFIAEWHD
jgi:Tol biopolymer transport system component